MNQLLKFLIPTTLDLLGKFVPDGFKVYVVALVGIMFAVSLFMTGDYTNGGMLLWGSFLALAGRHSVEKLQASITDATTERNPNG